MKEKNSLLLILKKKDAAPAQFSATWTECYEIQFHQPNKIVSGLIQSDIHHQMAANIGIKKTDNPQFQDITEPEAFIPIAKNPIIVCAPQIGRAHVWTPVTL